MFQINLDNALSEAIGRALWIRKSSLGLSRSVDCIWATGSYSMAFYINLRLPCPDATRLGTCECSWS
jgi:hypothetical protein